MKIGYTAKDFLSKIPARDGWKIIVCGTDIEDRFDNKKSDFDMMINDWFGYEIVEISQGHGSKQIVTIIVDNK